MPSSQALGIYHHQPLHTGSAAMGLAAAGHAVSPQRQRWRLRMRQPGDNRRPPAKPRDGATSSAAHGARQL